MKIIDITGELIIDHRSREWCKLPYPNHPKGCPNYGNSIECPPIIKVVEEIFDLEKSHWFIVTSFNLKEFSKRMKIKHPEWSEKQTRCCLYWQNTPRKELRIAIEEFKIKYPNTISTLIPEAMGVHVMGTVRKFGIPIKTKPTDIIYKIALVGYKK